MKYLRLIPTVLYLAFFFPMVVWYRLRMNKIPLEKRFKLTQRICRRLAKDFGIDYVVWGKENIPGEVNVIFMPNHQSMMDIVSLLAILPHPIRFVAKKETQKMFYVNMLADMIGSRYLNREDMRGAVQFSRDITQMMITEKPHLMLFPEGTRTKKPNYDLIEFKAGSFKIGQNAQSTLVPVAIFGTYKPLHKKIAQRRYRIDVSFLPPLHPVDYQDLSTPQLAHLFQSTIQTEVERLREFQTLPSK